jgi:hypothetical protein
MASTELDVRIQDFRPNGVGNGGFQKDITGTRVDSHPATILREIRRVLKGVPEKFTANDIKEFKGYIQISQAYKFLKTMRRMQIIKRVGNSGEHEVADFYKNKIF